MQLHTQDLNLRSLVKLKQFRGRTAPAPASATNVAPSSATVAPFQSLPSSRRSSPRHCRAFVPVRHRRVVLVTAIVAPSSPSTTVASFQSLPLSRTSQSPPLPFIGAPDRHRRVFVCRDRHHRPLLVLLYAAAILVLIFPLYSCAILLRLGGCNSHRAHTLELDNQNDLNWGLLSGAVRIVGVLLDFCLTLPFLLPTRCSLWSVP
ncbi:hypothetical protein E2542_SST16217 [Spatholobus suberectus]|nr:hypothetical protein E2542_SST16217 [Spatholobus suberectus]